MPALLLQQQQLARRTGPSVVTPDAPTFDRTVPALRQVAAWTCAATSTAWLLNAFGRAASENSVVAMLGPTNISPALGLLYGDGRGLVALLTGLGLPADNAQVSFDDALALALDTPFVMGGANWNHWTGVRGVVGDVLGLANPAPGWMGVGDTLTRDQFNALGPFWAVHPTLAAPAPTTGWSREQIIAISNALADSHEMPRVVLLGCAIAESNLVWDARRPASPADDERYWPDVSQGVWQKAIRWSDEYVQMGYQGEWPGRDVADRLLALYCDPRHSGEVAAQELVNWLRVANGDALSTLCLYNYPAGNGWSPNIENYRRGLAEAAQILGEEA